MEIVTPPSLVGQTLLESGLRGTYRLFVLAIKTTAPEEKYHFMPGAADVIQEGNVLILLGREVDLARFSALD